MSADNNAALVADIESFLNSAWHGDAGAYIDVQERFLQRAIAVLKERDLDAGRLQKAIEHEQRMLAQAERDIDTALERLSVFVPTERGDL